MDNREAGEYDPNINNHPPTCTCAECTNRRLGKKKQAIWTNLGKYLSFKRPEPEPKPEPASDEPTEEKPEPKPEPASDEPTGKGLSSFPPEPTIKTTKTLKQALGWLIPLVLIFSCTLIGFGISIFIGTAIPLWLLLGFSLIISIEKWIYYPTRKYKYIGKLYRLFLNLSMLCLLGLTIWTGIKLFSQQYFSSPLVGSLVFLAELAFFIWMLRTVSKNSWRWPSMKLTVFVLSVVFIILAFAGVKPLSTYKDTIVGGISNIFSSLNDEESSTSENINQGDDVPSSVSLTYDSYINEDIGISIDYPEGWGISEDTVLDKTERFTVSFNGVINGENNEIYVCGFTDSYEVWFNIFNTTTVADGLIIENGYVDGTKYSQFYRDRQGEEAWMYLFDCEEGALLITWSFPSASLSGDTIDLCVKEILKSFSIIPNPMTGMTSKGEYKNYFLGLVQTPDGVLSGNECYGEFIVLINNNEAKNPTYLELLDFLRSDKTDQYPYQYIASVLGFYYGDAKDKIDLIRIQEIIDGTRQPLSPMVCADFAERLHNNAELAGIRCGYVSLDVTGYTDPNNLGIASDSGHACNVFETTDRGLIYIDCTGISDNYGPTNNDRIVNIQIGQQYNPDYVFPSGGWIIPSGQMGVVTDMLVAWEGDWR